MRWVVRIVTIVRQIVSEKLYKRTDVSQLCTGSVARFPRTPITANTNSTPKADTLNYMQFLFVQGAQWRHSLPAYRVPTIHSKLHSFRNKQEEIVVLLYGMFYAEHEGNLKRTQNFIKLGAWKEETNRGLHEDMAVILKWKGNEARLSLSWIQHVM